MNDATSLSPLLYNNADDTVFVIDIPASITAAQYLPGQTPSSRVLLSCVPLPSPYASTEPKSAAAHARTQNHNDDSVTHSIYAALITEAQSEIRQRSSAQSPFCLTRHFRGTVEQSESRRASKNNRKRGFGDDDNDSKTVMLPSSHAQQNSQHDELLILENDTSDLLPIVLSSSQSPSSPIIAAYTHVLPPHNTILLSLITPASMSTFRRTARSHTPHTFGRFDSILLDPPWPNRSVTRSSSYSTASSLSSLTSLLLAMDLDIHIAPGGWVGMWITNKAAVRAAALELFDTWGVGLCEEWVWCKVTSSGEPVSKVDGVWRKPYEVCLIGQRGDGTAATWDEEQGDVKRRVLFGVPDLHSRKPCLKELVERLLLKQRRQEKYAALEVFARYAVAGWMSWGDEAVKYNGREWWIEKMEEDGDGSSEFAEGQKS